METPISVANFFVKVSVDAGTPVTPQKLCKLVYLSYAWYLTASGGNRLYPQQPEAWEYGVMIPSVYHAFSEYGDGDITSLWFNGHGVFEFPTNPETIQFLWKIWDYYKHYDGPQLSDLTSMGGAPYDLVFVEGENAVIPDDIIIDYYSKKSYNGG